MDGEQRKKARREDHQVWPPPLGTQAAVPRIRQYNIIIDVVGGWSTEVDEAMRKLFGARGEEILLRMQRAVISHTLNIARTLKVMS